MPLLQRRRITPFCPGMWGAGSPPPSTPTWDSAKKNAGITLSNGDLTASVGSNIFFASVLGSGSGRSTGKYYCEMTITAVNVDSQGFGFGNASANLSQTGGYSDRNSVSWWANNNVKVDNANTGSIQSWTAGDVLAMAVDLDAQLIWFRSNNSTNWNNSGTANPATGTGGVDYTVGGTVTLGAGPYFPMATLEITGDTYVLNTGGSAYNMTPPSGFGNW
jgi:hypothetical protein